MKFTRSIVLFIAIFITNSVSRQITVINHCRTDVLAAIQGPGNPEEGGFYLESEENRTIHLADKWEGGKIWGRTQCAESTKQAINKEFYCKTGSCGDKVYKCNGTFGTPPMTVAELSLGGLAGKDIYSVTVEYGFNLPMRIEPVDQKGPSCETAGGCSLDILTSCQDTHTLLYKPPFPFRDLRKIACKTDCLIHNTDEACCRGKFGSAKTCKETENSKLYKDNCNNTRIHSYEPKDTFKCSGANYLVHFC